MRPGYPLLNKDEKAILDIYIENMFPEKSFIYKNVVAALADSPIKAISSRLGSQYHYIKIEEAIRDKIIVKGRFGYELSSELIAQAKALCLDKDYYLSVWDVCPHRILNDLKAQKQFDLAIVAVAEDERVSRDALRRIITNTWASANGRTKKAIARAGLLVDREIGGCPQSFISEKGARLIRQVITLANAFADQKKSESKQRREELRPLFEARAEHTEKWRDRFIRSIRLINFPVELAENAIAAERKEYMRKMLHSGLSKGQIADQLGRSPNTMPSYYQIERHNNGGGYSYKADLYGEIRSSDPYISTLIRYARNNRADYVKDVLTLFASVNCGPHSEDSATISGETDSDP